MNNKIKRTGINKKYILPKSKKLQRCKRCNKALRVENKYLLCSSCYSKLSKEEKKKEKERLRKKMYERKHKKKAIDRMERFQKKKPNHMKEWHIEHKEQQKSYFQKPLVKLRNQRNRMKPELIRRRKIREKKYYKKNKEELLRKQKEYRQRKKLNQKKVKV